MNLPGNPYLKNSSLVMTLLAVLALALSACGGGDDKNGEIALTPEERASKVEDHFMAGEGQRIQGLMLGAITAYGEAIELNPQHADAYYGRARAYQGINAYRSAIADFDQAISLNPQNADAFYSRGRSYQELEDNQSAILDFIEAINLNTENANAYYSRGRAYEDTGDRQKALQDFSEAIRVNPKLAHAYGSRAVVYTHLGRDEEAQLDVEKAIELGAEPIILRTTIQQIKRQRQ